MGEKWICPKCGQENDDLFCIKCGSPRPEQSETVEEVKDAAETVAAETVEEITTQAEETLDKATAPAEEAVKAVEASPEVAATVQAATGMPAPKKKSLLLKIIIAAAVVVAAVIAVLCIFVFGKGKKTYEDDLGNYSIVIPAGYKMTGNDNGFIAENKNAVFYVDYVLTDFQNSLVRDWYDLAQYKDILFDQLETVYDMKRADFEILNPSTYGDNDQWAYSFDAICTDDVTAYGEVHLIGCDTYGVYLISYLLREDVPEKKAEKVREDFSKLRDSFEAHGDPKIPKYVEADLRDNHLGMIAVRSSLVHDIDDGKICIISDPNQNEEVMMEIIFANSILEIFSWEGITDGQIEESSSEKYTDRGRYDYDVYRCTYRDKKNNQRAYGIFGIFANASTPGVIAIEYDVSADMKDWAEEVVSDIMWSWNFGN